MIRVLQVLPRLRRGGSQAMIMNVYRLIDRTKIQFDFIIFSKDKDDYYDEIIKLGGRVFHFTKYNGRNALKVKKEWKQFFENHQEYKILHSHVRSFASLYIPVAKSYGLKTIIHSHSSANKKGLKGICKSILQRPLRKQADYLFACSQKAGEWLFGKKSISLDNYYFVPNGIDLNHFQYSEKNRELIRKKYGIEDHIKLIGHVGGIEHEKNHRFLINIFYNYLKINHDAKLMLVGKGTLLNKMRKLCEKLEIENDVIFAGETSDPSAFYSAFDVFVFPSLWEGFPVSLIEAQANGLPCLFSANITDEAKINANCEQISLKKISDWVSALNNPNITRTSKINHKIEEFSVQHTTDFLANFYERIQHE